MSQPSFVDLRMHLEFSVSDGINCARDDAQGVKPILGADILVANADDATASHRMFLLVKNHGGHLFDECAAVEKVAKTRLKDVAPAWTSSWGWIDGFYRPTR